MGKMASKIVISRKEMHYMEKDVNGIIRHSYTKTIL